MTREERQKANRTERRKAKQADHVLTAAVRAVGGGDVEDWCDVTGEYPTPLTRENGGAGE